MAVPTTLLAYSTGRVQQLTDEKTAAESRLRDIQLNLLPAARQQSGDQAAQSAVLNKQVATLRQQIAQAATTADAQALMKLLEQALVDLRAKDASQAQTQRQIVLLSDEQLALTASIGVLGQLLAAAQADQAAATARDKRLQDAKSALAAAPFSNIQNAANAALAGVAAADARIQGDVPAKLLSRAIERRQAAAQAATDAADATSAAAALAASHLKLATSQAENAMFTYIAQAQSRLDTAQATLPLVANAATSPLTAAEKARLNDASLTTPGGAAVDEEKPRDDAQKTLNAKQALLNDAILQARNSDIDTDPATVQAVKDATKERDDKLKALHDADNAFTSAMHDDLHHWEAALPDDNWALVDQLEDAKATLTELKDLDPATLPTAVATAETTWVAALFAADQKQRTARWIDAQVAARTSAQKYESEVNRHRKLTSLRGDL